MSFEEPMPRGREATILGVCAHPCFVIPWRQDSACLWWVPASWQASSEEFAGVVAA